MKRLLVLLPLILLTACSSVHVPPADYDEPETTVTETGTEPASSEPAATQSSTAHTTETTDEENDENETESTTEEIEIPEWAEQYAVLLRRKNAASEQIDAYYALIRLDPDAVPELVVLDDLTAELYSFTENGAELLLEDAYKGAAASGQNFCYQPETGRIASAFSTMGGGSGFNFFFYEKLDPMHVTRYCFNNNEAEGGEMPYNSLWDRAEEFDIRNNGWNDVTLGDSWTPIGTGFADLHKLVAVTGNKLTLEWENILGDIHETEEIETESESETKSKSKSK